MTQATLDRFKLPPAAMHFLVPLFLSCAMSCIVSLISTLRSLGFGDFELVGWLLSWMSIVDNCLSLCIDYFTNC